MSTEQRLDNSIVFCIENFDLFERINELEAQNLRLKEEIDWLNAEVEKLRSYKTLIGIRNEFEKLIHDLDQDGE